MKDSTILKGLDFQIESLCEFPESVGDGLCGGKATHLLACRLCGFSEYRCAMHRQTLEEYVAERAGKTVSCPSCRQQAEASRLLRLFVLPGLAETS